MRDKGLWLYYGQIGNRYYALTKGGLTPRTPFVAAYDATGKIHDHRSNADEIHIHS